MLHTSLSEAASINKCSCKCYTQKVRVYVNVYVNVINEFVKKSCINKCSCSCHTRVHEFSKAVNRIKYLCKCYKRVCQKLWVEINDIYVNVTHEF
jgi:hypothetical protein